MKTIYNTIVEACNNSRLSMLDANPVFFFGAEIPSPIPFIDGDILDYITSLTDGFMESENKLVIYNGRISKIDIDAHDCMRDMEGVECYPLAICEKYEEVCELYYKHGKKDVVYLVSKDYDANDNMTSFSLCQLVQLD